jgi:hypothetical protein
MHAPNIQTHQLADQMHAERLDHAARMRLAAEARGPHGTPRDRDALRRITARRLTATLAGALLSVAVAAGALALQADTTNSGAADAVTIEHGVGGRMLVR